MGHRKRGEYAYVRDNREIEIVRISIWIKEKRKKERGKVEQNFDGLVRGVGRIPQGDDWRKKKKKKQETKIL
ncbi:hypothetical protein RB195_018758 [Necator americanus]|uniref:Uncharacterized protein n=1 Tax=Necator americanus TaxID=51031 RepID=A0ABR1CE30_NECAM